MPIIPFLEEIIKAPIIRDSIIFNFVPNPCVIGISKNIDLLIKKLLADDSYKAIQKTLVKKSPLIDWIWLLVLIAISLASEWFIRKYNGLL